MTTVIRAGALIDGTGRAARTQVELVVDGGRIREVRDHGGPTTAAEGVRVINAPRLTVLPGLVDAHVHICSMPDPSPFESMNDTEATTLLKGVYNAAKTVRSGTTSIRVAGTRADLDMELKRGIDRGYFPGPRLVCAGKLLCITGGHGHFIGREFNGVDGARRAAREAIKAGADVLKMTVTGGIATPGTLYGAPQPFLEEIRAVVEAAHRGGKKVFVHAQGSQAIADAIAAGVDSIEHGFFSGPDDPNLAAMVDKGIFLVPTLVSYAMVLELGAEGGVPQEALDKTVKAIEGHARSFRLALAHGVRIAMGTDAGTEGNDHGTNAREMGYMVRNGMPAMDAIVASTRSGAELLGLADVGTLEPGKWADLMAVEGDPLQDISLLERPAWVMKGGELV